MEPCSGARVAGHDGNRRLCDVDHFQPATDRRRSSRWPARDECAAGRTPHRNRFWRGRI